MTRQISTLALRAALILVPLCGCDIHTPPAPPPTASGRVLNDGWGLATPERIGDFARVDVDDGGHPETGVTAGYTHMVDGEPVIATISVHPASSGDVLIPAISLGGDVGGDGSARAMEASIAEVRRFYPQAAIVQQADAFLVQRGALQQGKLTVLEYREFHAGQQRPMRLRIYSFCCIAGQWAYEYRFRYPAAVDDDFDIAVFLRESSWTVAPPS